MHNLVTTGTTVHLAEGTLILCPENLHDFRGSFNIQFEATSHLEHAAHLYSFEYLPLSIVIPSIQFF
jgi:hypothetical protein